MQFRWKTRFAAFVVTLSVFLTGGMGAAIAAEPLLDHEDHELRLEC